jgi:aminoglycoside 3-N-acetyltransferase
VIEVSAQLESMRIEHNDVVMIHSSLKEIAVSNANNFLQAIEQFLSAGLLVLPTHTWKYQDEPDFVYNPLTSPSCVGTLTNLFLKRKGVFRSAHPSHSIAAKGIGATAFASGEELINTPCARHGCWGKLYDLNAKILFVGCSMKRNTIIHGVEEWNQIPNRLSREPKIFKIKTRNGIVERPYFTHDTPFDISEHYDKIQPSLLEKGIAWKGRIGQAETIVCQTKPMVDFVTELLRTDPDYFWTAD